MEACRLEPRERADLVTWNRKPCGCVRARLPRAGKVVIRCTKHHDKPARKRLVAYFDADGIVRTS